MLLFLLTIAITSLLVIIFRLFVMWDVDPFQAIVYNYIVCLLLGSFISWEMPFNQHHLDSDWFPFAIILGCLFIIGFSTAAETVRHFGVSVTSVVQRISLVISAGFAILFFQESVHGFKLTGIVISLASIFLINFRARHYANSGPVNRLLVLLPLLTWILSGLVESILFYLSARGLSAHSELEITTLGFGTAGILGLTGLAGLVLFGNRKFSLKALKAGILLGIPNYFSIYLIFVLLKKGFEGSVLFPMLNISVLVVGTLSGILFFSERLNRYQAAGVIFALIAIILLTLT